MIWEAHKCSVRGELMRMGAQRKRDKEKEITKLTDKISNLESQHKQSLTTRSAAQLLETRKTLQQLVDATAKRFLFFRKKIYYEYGDKTGKFFARALRGP